MRRIKRFIIAALAATTLFPVAAAEAAPRQCYAAEGYDVTVCVVVKDTSGTAKGRVFQAGEDVFGIVNFGVSARDKACKPDADGNPVYWKNCGDTGDFITPFSSYDYPWTALCSTSRVPSNGAVCGDRKLASGLRNVVVFDSPVGVFAIHRYGTIGESHGCIRASRTVSSFIYTAHNAGQTVALVVLDRR